jgi:hypothetical protein
MNLTRKISRPQNFPSVSFMMKPENQPSISRSQEYLQTIANTLFSREYRHIRFRVGDVLSSFIPKGTQDEQSINSIGKARYKIFVLLLRETIVLGDQA